MPHSYRRADRVANLIQAEIAQMLERELRDPRLKKVTITRVSLTDDLKLARVYFSLIGTKEEQKQAEEGFLRAKGLIKKLIGERVYLKFVPEIEFFFDQSLEYAQRIEELIHKIHEEDESDSEDL